MDEELQRLEAELSGLRPCAPSANLRQRIHEDLEHQRHRRIVVWLTASALPLAAGLAIFTWLPRHVEWPGNAGNGVAQVRENPGTAPASHAARTPVAGTKTTLVDAGTLKPVSVENVLYAMDQGTVVLDDGTAARRERLQYVDTIEWRDPRTHASLTWSIPREEVRVVPISYQ